MKMFGKKSLSAVLYWLFILCFIILIILIFQALYFYAHPDYSNTTHNGYPFILISLLAILPKTVSFYLLIMIFKSFKTDTIFTKKTLTYLNIFTVFSLCMPIVNALFNYFSLNVETYDILNIMFPNLMLGVFAAFIAAIFKRGFHLKKENELTI